MLHQMNHCPRTRPRPRSMTHVPLSPKPFRLQPVNAAVCRRIEALGLTFSAGPGRQARRSRRRACLG
jgi:hypothetical protein